MGTKKPCKLIKIGFNEKTRKIVLRSSLFLVLLITAIIMIG